jgi:tetratricopeptide (TPR) repeat protein
MSLPIAALLMPSRLMFYGPCYRSALLSAWLLCAATAPVWAADNAADTIRQAIQAGNLEQAEKLVRQERQRAPDDIQLRFLDGLIKAQTSQADKSIEIFRKLSEEQPNLPEPLNNLGVLYASKGQYEEAKAAFEKALKTNPSYAAANKNLSDVYAQLAKKSYARALQVDEKTKAVPIQFTLLGAMGMSKPEAPGLGVKPMTAITATAPVPGLTLNAPKAPEKPLAVAPVVPPAAKLPAERSNPVTKAPAPLAKPEPTARVATAEKADTRAIEAALQAWAQGWSNKNVDQYLGAYSASFDTPKGLSRKEWEAERRVRIAGRKYIRVKLLDLKIETKGNQATASFKQKYESDNINTLSGKTLFLIKQGDRWQIAREKLN